MLGQGWLLREGYNRISKVKNRRVFTTHNHKTRDKFFFLGILMMTIENESKLQMKAVTISIIYLLIIVKGNWA